MRKVTLVPSWRPLCICIHVCASMWMWRSVCVGEGRVVGVVWAWPIKHRALERQLQLLMMLPLTSKGTCGRTGRCCRWGRGRPTKVHSCRPLERYWNVNVCILRRWAGSQRQVASSNLQKSFSKAKQQPRLPPSCITLGENIVELWRSIIAFWFRTARI